MTIQLTDQDRASATVRIDETRPIGEYTVHLADGTLAGSADFLDSPDADRERIFFHTEVDEEFSGQGVGGLLVREILADSIRKQLTIVPVCPLIAAHLKKQGAKFLADGGRFRPPTRADFGLLSRMMGIEL
jgi:uncharacterized protein